jgi:taurine--2-oxoglutarate transaminase
MGRRGFGARPWAELKGSRRVSWIAEKTGEHVFYTWSKQRGVKPIEIAGGTGSWFWDTDGKRWLDFSSQVFNANLGHQHPRVVAAIQEQAGKLSVAGPKMAYEAKALLGQKLAEVTPGSLTKTFFTLGGAEANENAVKMARTVTGRLKIVTRYRSYHGATLGALALTGDPRRLPFEPLLGGVVRVHDPYCYRCPWGKQPDWCQRECARTIEETILLEDPRTVAAVLLEGFAGANGVLVPPDDYWPRVREICDKYGILLISDEVFTGLGRTGKWFAVDHYGVVPDMITLAKGLGAGHVPLGAVVVSDRVASYFDDEVLMCGLTSYAPPVCVAAALETLRVYEDEGLVAHAALMGDVAMSRLRAFKEQFPFVGDVRGKGLLAIIELSDPATGAPLVPFNASAKDMERLAPLASAMAERGLYIFMRWNFVIIAPPINISQEDLLAGFDVIEHGLRALELVKV